MVALIEPLLESGPELGIDLVATGEVDRLLIPGTVALAPFRSAQAAAAERCGVPALLHDLPNPLALRLGLKAKMTRDEIDEVADHIAEFSLAGIRALRTSLPSAATMAGHAYLNG